MKGKESDTTIEIDLHNLKVDEALCKLKLRIDSASSRVRCIRVIHGYNSGTAIKNALTAKNLNSPRIATIEPLFLNSGVTLIWLKY